MINVKQINITNRTYYFHNDIINIEEFDSNWLFELCDEIKNKNKTKNGGKKVGMVKILQKLSLIHRIIYH